MSKRRIWISLVILAAVAVAVLVYIRFVRMRSGDSKEEVGVDMAVHVGKISRATLHRYVVAYGAVEPEPAGLGRIPADAEVASPVSGIVAHIDCHEGQTVAKGTLLFQLDSRVADVAYEKAKKALAYAEENFARQKKLLPVDGTSKKNYLEAEQQLNTARSELATAETNLALLKVQAPLAGTVVKINTKPGQAVELNTVLATIIDLERLVASVSVPSREAAALKVGQQALFEGRDSGQGRVVYIGLKIDDKTDTLPVRISVPSGGGFHPGKFLSVRIVCEEHVNCLAVPEAAAISDSVESETGAIVLVDGDKAVRKPVKLGLRENGLVEVAGDGLKEGLVIVTEDAYAVPGQVKIHIID